MMRIKVWDKAFKLWIKEPFSIFYNDAPTVTVTFKNDHGYDVMRVVGEDCEIVRSTGLHDKNGKEIWEGDILRRMNGRLDVVEFEPGAFVVRHPQGDSDFIAQTNNYEVLGNIHENGDLLK